VKGLLVTYVMAYGGALVSLFDPFVGLLIYVCFAIIKPEALWFWSFSQVGNYSRIVAIALLIGWLGRGFGSWQFGRARGIVYALVLFWLWTLICAALAPNGPVAFDFVESITKILLPFLVGLTVIDSTKKIVQLAWVISLSYGYLAYEFNLSYFQGRNRLLLDGFAGMEEGSVAFSFVTAAGLSFFLGLATQTWWKKTLAFVAAGLLVHAVLFSFSRGGMLGLVVVAVVTFFLIPKRPAHILLFAVALALGLRLAGPEVWRRFNTSFAAPTERDESAQSRLDLWGNCWELMRQHPLTGIGPRHFPLVAHRFGWPPGKEAHSLWLSTGAELGFPGLLFLGSFYGLCIVRLWRMLLRHTLAPDPFYPHAARMVIASLVGFAVSAQFISLETLELPFYVTLLGAAVLKLSSVEGAGAAADPRVPDFQHPMLVPQPSPATSPSAQPN
jgi:putative inorganic carbon (hco3(-)) transporter